MSLRIDILTRDGSPLNVCLDDAYGKHGRIGVGGAELALLTMCEAWHNAGHTVTLYNDPSHSGSPFEQRMVCDFDPLASRDILVIFRSPNPLVTYAKGKKIWWSCDQRTIGDFKEFATEVDKIVTISQFHSDFFESMYGITDTIPIDLPVRGYDYDLQKRDTPKVKNQCLFSSVPDRGLPVLARVWPRIVEQVPDASLVITSGWTLWTGQSDQHLLQNYRALFGTAKNVNYVGAVPREELVKYQLQSDLFLFPNVYDELFCIAASEAQWAGVWPITSNVGALRTTNMGTIIMGNPNDPTWQDAFVEQTVKKLTCDNLTTLQKSISQRARERFNIKYVLSQWNKKVFS